MYEPRNGPKPRGAPAHLALNKQLFIENQEANQIGAILKAGIQLLSKLHPEDAELKELSEDDWRKFIPVKPKLDFAIEKIDPHEPNSVKSIILRMYKEVIDVGHGKSTELTFDSVLDEIEKFTLKETLFLAINKGQTPVQLISNPGHIRSGFEYMYVDRGMFKWNIQSRRKMTDDGWRPKELQRSQFSARGDQRRIFGNDVVFTLTNTQAWKAQFKSAPANTKYIAHDGNTVKIINLNDCQRHKYCYWKKSEDGQRWLPYTVQL